jgi:hypothetical protein
MSGKSELAKIMRSLPHMNKEEHELAVARLKEFGIETPTEPVRRPGVECPYMKMQVVSPCNLKKCKFHIENEWSRNCILEYIDVQGNEALASEEIAFLYGTSTAKVDAVIEKGMVQLRENSEETVGIAGTFEKHVEPTISANVDSDEDFTITAATLSPSFMKPVNLALDTAISQNDVFQHPAIRILGVLDTIIDELE